MNLRDVILELLEAGVILNVEIKDGVPDPDSKVQTEGKAQIIKMTDRETGCVLQLIFFVNDRPNLTENINSVYQTLKQMVETYKKEQNG